VIGHIVKIRKDYNLVEKKVEPVVEKKSSPAKEEAKTEKKPEP